MRYTSTFSSESGNVINCGFSQNMLFTIGDIHASNIIPWARMYRQVRLRRIRIRITGYRTDRVVTGNTTLSTSRATNEQNATLGVIPYRRLGGEMVFLATNKCGVVPEESVGTLELQNGSWTNHTGYGLLNENRRLRRHCRWRSNVAFGMRPVYLSFTPGIPYPKRAWAPRYLVGQSSEPENSGIIYPNWDTNFSTNLSNMQNMTMKASPWMDMVAPAGSASSTPNMGAAAVSSAGNILEDPLTSFGDFADRWWAQPYLGLYVGLQGQTATMWPSNLRYTISYDLQFRGFRNWDTVSNGGTPFPYFKDYGLIPNIRNSNW